MASDTCRMESSNPLILVARSWALALMLGASVANAASATGDGSVQVGQSLPDATMAGLNSPPRTFASYRGKPLIVNVWASWCTPCRAEAASLERFAWSEAGKPYVVIGISTDDDRTAALKWLRESNATLSHFIDANVVLENMLGASRIPLTVLVDAQGRVVDKVRGAREWDSPESVQLIQRAFRGSGKTPPRQ